MRRVLLLSKSLSGWRLFSALLIGQLVMTGTIALFDPSVDGLRDVVLSSTCYTFFLFIVIFSSSSLQALSPSIFFSWLLRNRRFVGLSYAATQTVHVVAVGVFAIVAPGIYASESTVFSQLLGIVAFLFAIAMAVTSFRPMKMRLGPARWTLLHKAGMYSIWIAYAWIFGKRVVKHPAVPLYIVVVSLLVLCLLLRFLARGVGRKRASSISTDPTPASVIR